MGNSIAADSVMLLHFCFIAFALAGSFLILRYGWLIYLHIPALVWGVWIEASGNICPLTPLENHFRELAGLATYGEGFITHYLEPMIYPTGLTRNTQFVLMGVLIAVNLIGYGLVLAQRRRRTSGPRITFRKR
jgi:hypothetical protein